MHPLFAVGVARGDVQRIEVTGPGIERRTVYTRGITWGQFEVSTTLKRDDRVQLLVYGDHGLVQTLTLHVPPGSQRTYD